MSTSIQAAKNYISLLALNFITDTDFQTKDQWVDPYSQIPYLKSALELNQKFLVKRPLSVPYHNLTVKLQLHIINFEQILSKHECDQAIASFALQNLNTIYGGAKVVAGYVDYLA